MGGVGLDALLGSLSGLLRRNTLDLFVELELEENLCGGVVRSYWDWGGINVLWLKCVDFLLW